MSQLGGFSGISKVGIWSSFLKIVLHPGAEQWLCILRKEAIYSGFKFKKTCMSRDIKEAISKPGDF